MPSLAPAWPLGVRRPCPGRWWALRSRCAPTTRLPFLCSPWHCHGLCRSSTRTLEPEGEFYSMELHRVQLTVGPKLARPADVLPLLLAKPHSAWCGGCAGRLRSTPRRAVVRHLNSVPQHMQNEYEGVAAEKARAAGRICSVQRIGGVAAPLFLHGGCCKAPRGRAFLISR